MAEVVKEWDGFQTVAIPLNLAMPIKGLKRGQLVSRGEKLANHPELNLGNVHSSLNGLITEINEFEITIQRDENAVGQPPQPLNWLDCPSDQLPLTLKELGLNQPELPPSGLLVVSALNPEPGLNYASALAAEHRETLVAGLEALERMRPAVKIVWVVNEPEKAPPEADYFLPGPISYPYSLPELVAKLAAKAQKTTAIGAIDLSTLYDLGRVWRTGLPQTRLVLTLGGSNYFVPVGARIIDLLTLANLVPSPGDTVIKGGLVRGLSLSRLECGLAKGSRGLHLLRGAARPIKAIKPCRNCGQCTQACPIHLPVQQLAEMEPQTWRAGNAVATAKLRGCHQCGACALACPASRPLLAMVRLMTKQPPKANGIWAD